MTRRVFFDEARAEDLVDRLLALYRAKGYPFDRSIPVSPAREFHPPAIAEGSDDHARYLFHSCNYMRGGIKSRAAMSAFFNLAACGPSPWFTEEAAQVPEERLRRELLRAGLGYNAKWVPRTWIHNAKMLNTYWEGTPVTIFRAERDAELIFQEIRGLGNKDRALKGFGKKMLSMLYFYLLEVGLAVERSFPIPVDFHVMRLMLSHRALWVDGGDPEENLYEDDTCDVVRAFSVRMQDAGKASFLDLTNALWGFGSRMCQLHPGNGSTDLDRSLRKGRASRVIPVQVTWNNKQVSAYEKSCGRCPVEKTCELTFPSAYHYRQGRLRTRGRREVPEQYQLSLSLRGTT